MAQICTVADFCEGLGLPVTMVPEMVDAFKRREVLELAKHEEKMTRCAGRPDNKALPLMDEGHEFGRVEARIPATLFWNLAFRDGFGWEGLQSDEGISDILKDNPQCRVNTVSGKIQSGWTPGRKVVKRYNL